MQVVEGEGGRLATDPGRLPRAAPARRQDQGDQNAGDDEDDGAGDDRPPLGQRTVTVPFMVGWTSQWK